MEQEKEFIEIEERKVFFEYSEKGKTMEECILNILNSKKDLKDF